MKDTTPGREDLHPKAEVDGLGAGLAGDGQPSVTREPSLPSVPTVPTLPGDGPSKTPTTRAEGSMQRRLMPFRIRTWIAGNPAALKAAVEQVSRMAHKRGCPEERRTDLEIALMEALANAMKHGNAGRGESKIFLRCYGGPVGMVVAVRDQGRGFDPARVPDPRSPDRLHLGHGRGLLLMRELTDYVEHRKGGREVVLLRINH